MHKKKAGKLQTGSTFPKQYWLAVNGKPKRGKAFWVSIACMWKIAASVLLKLFLNCNERYHTTNVSSTWAKLK